MTRKHLFSVLGLILVSITAIGQNRPYFQQRVNYTIEVSLNDTLHELSGKVSMTYINHSPDTLTKLFIHLWPNAYQNNNTALVRQELDNNNTNLYFAKPSERGRMDHLSFSIDKIPVDYRSFEKNGDIAEIALPNPLAPGDSMVVETPFRVKIPGDFSRMGHKEQAYQISQWYPKPAVYDREGWHPMPYLDLGEFYGEFGSFDVSITLPENYMVAATGVLQNNPEEEVRIRERITLTQTGNFKAIKELFFFPKSSTKLKTLHFHQDSIHDFAWFADKRYLIDKKSILLHNKPIDLYAYYLPFATDGWKNATQFISKAIQFYSKRLGDYPYAVCSAVQGSLKAGGGMEYPMITVLNDFTDPKTLEQVVVHEVGHNWLYGILGFNERKYPWLDEGINSFYENDYMAEQFPNSPMLSDLGLRRRFSTLDLRYHYGKLYTYLFLAAQNDLQPIGLSSEQFSGLNYGVLVYYTPVILLRHLRGYLGEAQFNQIMLDFATTWRFRHPGPTDLQSFMEEKSGKDLRWFFDQLINTATPIDHKVNWAKKESGTDSTWLVKTTDKNRIGAPFTISVLDKSGNILSSTWRAGMAKSRVDTIQLPKGGYKISINEGYDDTEANKRDNSIRLSGWFRKWESPKLNLLWKIASPSNRPILYSPIIGWNIYDRWMPGLALYSDPVIAQKLEYTLLPMVSIHNRTLTGSGDVGYNIRRPLPGIRNIRIGILAKQFGYDYLSDLNQYLKAEPSITIRFATPFRKNITHELLIRSVYVKRGIDTPTSDQRRNLAIIKGRKEEYNIPDIRYEYRDKKAIHPWGVMLDGQIFKSTVRLSTEIKGQYTYAKKRGVDFRLFMGKTVNPSTQFSPNLNFYASGYSPRRTGASDYLFDHTILGRSETSGVFAYQYLGNDGGFKTPTPLGGTNEWLAAFNITAPLPGKLPLKLFANIATFAHAKEVLYNGEIFIYEAGIQLNLIRNVFEIYLPCYISPDMKRVADLNNQKFTERIRFKLNLNELNPLKAIKGYKQIEF